jgi:hypothetical protein
MGNPGAFAPSVEFDMIMVPHFPGTRTQMVRCAPKKARREKRNGLQAVESGAR